MRYRTLGGTGIEVSVHCLGTMMFGAVGNPDHDECVRIIHAALDHGINFVDTADMCSAGESEQIVGAALRGRRDGASVTLDDATLDRIDEIVPPGTNMYQPDGAWRPLALPDPAQRRRPFADRAAS